MRVTALVGWGAFVLAGCGTREIPGSSPPLLLVAGVTRVGPGERQAGGSLFGTDVYGLADGSMLTPDAAPGAHLFAFDPGLGVAPRFRAGGPVTTALSPDGKTLVLLTSG